MWVAGGLGGLVGNGGVVAVFIAGLVFGVSSCWFLLGIVSLCSGIAWFVGLWCGCAWMLGGCWIVWLILILVCFLAVTGVVGLRAAMLPGLIACYLLCLLAIAVGFIVFAGVCCL